MDTKTFTRGQVIFNEGDFPEVMYMILGGQVGVYSGYKTEDMALITTLGEGELLGEMGMIELRPRSATAVALTDDTVVAEINYETFTQYFRDDPGRLLAILRQLSKRIRETNKKYMDACRTLYESDQAEKNGDDLNELLLAQQQMLIEEYRHMFY